MKNLSKGTKISNETYLKMVTKECTKSSFGAYSDVVIAILI